VGIDRKTISRWLVVGRCPERSPPAAKRHCVDPYRDFILERYGAGLDNAAQLARELRAGLDYMEPVYYRGDPEKRRSERAAKLRTAREERRRSNAERLELAA